MIDSDAIFELDTVLPLDVNVESVAIINSPLVDTELTAVSVRWSKDKSSLIEPKIRTVILLLVADAFVNWVVKAVAILDISVEVVGIGDGDDTTDW